MPKLKPSKSVAKRFNITGGGKIKRRRAGKSHLLSKKPRSRKRALCRPDLVVDREAKKAIKKLLPYG